MTGYLIVNHFMDGAHFAAVHNLFLEAAAKRGVTLRRVTSGEVQGEMTTPPTDRPDFAIFWDKDVPIARRLERFGWRLFNSAEAVRICDNKADTAEALAAAGLPTPRTITAPITFPTIGYAREDFVRAACEELGLPVVIKEFYGSFGEQVYLAHTVEEACAVVRTLGARPFLFQEMITSSFGVDIRVNVVGGRVVAAMRRQGAAGDFRSNIAIGGHGTPVTLDADTERVAILAARAVGADFAGVDVLCGPSGEPLICEVNSNPQFLGTYRACGVNVAEAVLAHILDTVG